MIDLFKLVCDLHKIFLLVLVFDHLLELSVEESCLLQLPLFRPYVLCLLEPLSHLPILLSSDNHLHLFSFLLLLLTLGFKFDHVFIGRLQFDRLCSFSLRFAILGLLSEFSRF